MSTAKNKLTQCWYLVGIIRLIIAILQKHWLLSCAAVQRDTADDTSTLTGDGAVSPTMELLRSVIGGGGSSSSGATNGSAGSAAETIERLVSRMSSSTLLEDRRDACRALKAMSRKFRVEVGAQVLFLLIVVENY